MAGDSESSTSMQTTSGTSTPNLSGEAHAAEEFKVYKPPIASTSTPCVFPCLETSGFATNSKLQWRSYQTLTSHHPLLS